MRENRLSGSEGGLKSISSSYPYQAQHHLFCGPGRFRAHVPANRDKSCRRTNQNCLWS